MAPYSPPSGDRAGKLRLDFNENTVGCSPRVLAYVQERLDRNIFSVYPEYAETRERLAAFFGVAEPQLVLTNGTDEAIQVLVNTYVDDGDDVLVLQPSYAMYRFYSEVAGAAVREIPYRKGTLAFPIDELLLAIRPETKAILIANPNNPTGAGIDVAGLRRILDRAPRAVVLIDEAYYEFSGVTALALLGDYPNLFVSRTFSKAYGMAAMRIGCILTRSDNAAYLRKGQSPYSVNLLASIAVRAAVDDVDYVRGYVGEVLRARDVVCEGFGKLGIPYYPSQANFVLFQAGSRAIEIRDRLRAVGVLVRDRSYEIAGCVRATIGTMEQSRRFLRELEKIW
ncbi:MAG: aminotransferase class I/II-fold pyridoxal phosphate-dependent enzyme [Candidatus Solibacter usitatus]|nr:aminotransferase class I/II-fold pyridoxal phosphate-dependent enzyme [Candidatus Solibacter usitatus]